MKSKKNRFNRLFNLFERAHNIDAEKMTEEEIRTELLVHTKDRKLVEDAIKILSDTTIEK